MSGLQLAVSIRVILPTRQEKTETVHLQEDTRNYCSPLFLDALWKDPQRGDRPPGQPTKSC